MRKHKSLVEERLNLLLTILKLVREVLLILSMAINYERQRGGFQQAGLAIQV